ncbi:hypothetical protein CFF01_10940 [Shewanella marisflavi]|uniref:diguanylate cyclase n=1 Tax=Shewanella marisflavi TaxID=260364 RepID=A0AAC9XNL9_9GAMM|nr:hypothetical protein CFF01_10940 [Shewanella marisflavi]
MAIWWAMMCCSGWLKSSKRRYVRQILLAAGGGEEFVIILEDTDSEGATSFADKLRQDIKHRSQESDFPVVITVSAGVSLYRWDDDQDRLFNDADQALYRAKENGRDCVVVI